MVLLEASASYSGNGRSELNFHEGDMFLAVDFGAVPNFIRAISDNGRVGYLPSDVNYVSLYAKQSKECEQEFIDKLLYRLHDQKQTAESPPSLKRLFLIQDLLKLRFLISMYGTKWSNTVRVYHSRFNRVRELQKQPAFSMPCMCGEKYQSQCRDDVTMCSRSENILCARRKEKDHLIFQQKNQRNLYKCHSITTCNSTHRSSTIIDQDEMESSCMPIYGQRINQSSELNRLERKSAIEDLSSLYQEMNITCSDHDTDNGNEGDDDDDDRLSNENLLEYDSSVTKCKEFSESDNNYEQQDNGDSYQISDDVDEIREMSDIIENGKQGPIDDNWQKVGIGKDCISLETDHKYHCFRVDHNFHGFGLNDNYQKLEVDHNCHTLEIDRNYRNLETDENHQNVGTDMDHQNLGTDIGYQNLKHDINYKSLENYYNYRTPKCDSSYQSLRVDHNCPKLGSNHSCQSSKISSKLQTSEVGINCQSLGTDSNHHSLDSDRNYPNLGADPNYQNLGTDNNLQNLGVNFNCQSSEIDGSCKNLAIGDNCQNLGLDDNYKILGVDRSKQIVPFSNMGLTNRLFGETGVDEINKVQPKLFLQQSHLEQPKKLNHETHVNERFFQNGQTVFQGSEDKMFFILANGICSKLAKLGAESVLDFFHRLQVLAKRIDEVEQEKLFSIYGSSLAFNVTDYFSMEQRPILRNCVLEFLFDLINYIQNFKEQVARTELPIILLHEFEISNNNLENEYKMNIVMILDKLLTVSEEILDLPSLFDDIFILELLKSIRNQQRMNSGVLSIFINFLVDICQNDRIQNMVVEILIKSTQVTCLFSILIQQLIDCHGSEYMNELSFIKILLEVSREYSIIILQEDMDTLIEILLSRIHLSITLTIDITFLALDVIILILINPRFFINDNSQKQIANLETFLQSKCDLHVVDVKVKLEKINGILKCFIRHGESSSEDHLSNINVKGENEKESIRKCKSETFSSTSKRDNKLPTVESQSLSFATFFSRTFRRNC